MRKQEMDHLIREASAYIGNTWPLYGFVTSNPLTGYEKKPFDQAVGQAHEILGARVFPEAAQFSQAFHSGEIDRHKLEAMLQEHGFDQTPEYYLELLEAETDSMAVNPFHETDRITAKWLAVFMDEGLAEWSMPGKEKGFYQAWKILAPYDDDLKRSSRKTTYPESAGEAIAEGLAHLDKDDHLKVFTAHLAALPGWTGYIKLREEKGSAWQEQYPITLEDYLAVRFCIAKALDAPLLVQAPAAGNNPVLPQLQYLWLKAWEASWQEKTLQMLKAGRTKAATEDNTTTPDAQLVFCIDTRSEPIRRHVEAAGNYETFGYAGFFGIAMDYVDPDNGQTRKSCPPIVPSAYRVTEKPAANKEAAFEAYRKTTEVNSFITYFMKRMKNMLPSTFGFVEGSGIGYGFGIFLRTCFPGKWYRRNQSKAISYEGICEPGMHAAHQHDAADAIPLNEKVGIVKSAFDLLGWKTFAPLVVFSGHGSHTANNPFGSSLDCGACAASPGRHNARMLAKLANDRAVRETLLKEHGVLIPDTTWFVGAEHTTTTDRIELFDAGAPQTHRQLLSQLRKDLDRAQQTATAERLHTEGNGVALAEQKAGNWAETRPEWGLAKNAGFIIAPRTSTANIDLQGRCFLHSYDWKHDKEGKALEGIMQGPMVVTQWINNHYYFSSVDVERFGSGSKITHNVTGMFGVVQGNGGDLKTGLPLQSLRATDTEIYHQPLRLSVMIEAPVERVTDILSRNENLRTLLDNQWIYLIVNDPSGKELKTYRYNGNLEWEPRVVSAEAPVQKRKKEQAVAQ